ncbi:helix-turn-helix domain-containing protein [Klebsiella pneumoniae]
MATVSISEAARLTGKSRTTLHRLIKAGELSTCRGERNAKMLETSELLRVFGAFAPVSVEQEKEQVSGQRDTVTSDRNEQVIYILKQEIEHLNTLLASRDSHIDSLKQAMLLLENREEMRQNTTRPRAWWRFWQS